jgi:hypothetical protein
MRVEAMLKINQAQIAAFEAVLVKSFVVQQAKHLRRVLSAQVASFDDSALARSLRVRLGHALAYGVTDRYDVLRYLECSYLLGWPDDGPDAEAHVVLNRRDLSARKRMDLIEQRTERMG